MSIELHKSSVTETANSRSVEMLFTDGSDPEQSDELLHFRFHIGKEGYPRIAAAQLEALARARNVIGDETHRLEQIRGRVHPGEDWRK